jgi:hypothetical protein
MSYETEERYHLNFNKAAGPFLPTKIDENVWTIVSAHKPGRMRLPVKLPNRSFIYKLKGDDGKPFLVLLNAIVCDEANDQPFTAIRALSEREGAPVRYILTPASSHNICLLDYARSFPDAKVRVPDGRLPQRRALDLMKLDNVEVFDNGDPLPELRRAGLHVHVWKGMREGPMLHATSKFPFTLIMPSHNEPGDLELTDLQECIVFHEESGSITNGGHHLWFRPPGAKMPMALKGQAPKEGFNWGPKNGYPISDKAAFKSSVDHVLAWDFDKIFDVHTPPNALVRSGGKALFSDFMSGVRSDDWTGAPLDPRTYPSG